MNKFTKTLILGVAAVATLATTFEAASAGDRTWRNRGFHERGWRYHHGGFHGGVAAGIIGGLAAGVIVSEALSQPRVVYRERPVYVDPDYVEPEAEYVGPVDGYADPDEDGYVEQRAHRPVQSQHREVYQDQMDEQAEDENYFPDRPQKQHTRQRNEDVAQQGTLQPWTAQWRNYCKQRFSTFNATTGTYTGYDGKSHFCTAG